jgi:Ca2+-binding RTX toxin-like protein
MATYEFDTVAGTTITFVPATDTLNFQTGSAAQLDFVQVGSDLRVMLSDGRYVDLAGDTLADLTSADLTFADGSLFLLGTSGNEMLTGSVNDDFLFGNGGTDTLVGGDGDDTYVVDSGGDVVTETSTGGIDTVRETLSGYAIGANIENARILSTGAANVYGNSLDNTIWAGAGDNYISGGAGSDTVSYGYSTSGVNAWLALAGAQNTGGSGSDTLVSIENLIGSAFNDSLKGNSANNILNGGDGNDTLNGGLGADTMIGGTGNDVFVIDRATDVIVENAGEGTDTVQSSLSSTTLGANLENLIIATSTDANAYGNSLNNIIFAGAGNNIINGGLGTDTVSYLSASGPVTIDLSIAGAQNTTSSGIDTLQNIENVDGSAYNDYLHGNSLVNRLSGGAGNDTLDGGSGNDVLIGGLGSDTYYAQTGDIVIEQVAAVNGGGTDTVITTSASYTLGANLEWLQLAGTGPQDGYGNVLDNVIFAGSGDNIMNGFSGNDTVSYLNATAGVNINLDLTVAQTTGGSGSDTLLDFENLIGSNFDDVLIGSEGDNTINALQGNDLIIGDGGSDKLIGGDGADVFRYQDILDSGPAEVTRDLITDFTQGVDHIDLSMIDADLVTAGDQAFTFIGSADFSTTDATGQLRYDATLGVLYASNDADADAEFSIALQGMPALQASDMVL